MRISDWSSDVCSSDLRALHRFLLWSEEREELPGPGSDRTSPHPDDRKSVRDRQSAHFAHHAYRSRPLLSDGQSAADDHHGKARRSEERRAWTECVSTCSSRWSTAH